ncbi:MAG: radical SAM protein, partial [Alphaproteobacteria bacterium]
MMDAELLRKYDLRVPRYTSYPTAPHFGSDVDGSRYAGWLHALAADVPLSLYVHIPFCRHLCWFCGCNTRAVNRYEPIAHYVDLLKTEIDRVAEALGPKRTVRHLHWGGGTPTILRGADFLDLMGFLRARFDFAEDAEIAVEIDPRVTTRETVAGLAEGGTTRASIGVQDFDPAVQQAINRFQSSETTAAVAEWLRADGIVDLNLDLLYGLPKQTAPGVARTMERALTLAPARVAMFGYAHVPWMKSHQELIDAETLPDAAQRLAQFEAAAEVLREAGY